LVPEHDKAEVLRRYAKYIFLDVVKFSSRSAETQSDIIDKLNRIVRYALEDRNVEKEDYLLIPTGDGMCVALINPSMTYDLHMQIALDILKLLDSYNKRTPIKTRQFQVRIGINENTDILVTDINHRRNIAGAGINMASRVMDKADGGQILISQIVYEALQPTELYMDKFRPFDAEGKHGLRFRVYQYVDKSNAGLNCAKPSEFVQKQAPELKLSEEVAYYFAHAIRNKKLILREQAASQNNYSLAVILWFLAIDSAGAAKATEIAPYKPQIYGGGKASLEDMYNHYQSLDFQIILSLADFINAQLLKFRVYLDSGGIGHTLLFVNDRGKEKLKKDWPDIWKEFGLDKV
jgi:class 3 adenylate cyclase